VVIADDTMVVRQGVAAIVAAIDGVEVVAECDDLPSLLAAVERDQPDVVLTDVCMPPTMTDEGVQAARRIRADHVDVGVVVLSQFAEPEYVVELFDQGSDRLGYLLKDHLGEPAELERAIRAVHTGGSVVDPRIVEVLVSAGRTRSSPVDRLTPRERDVMALIAEGLNNGAIAGRLVLSEKAVAKHINSIFTKLDLGAADDAHKRVKSVLTWLAAN
jgi:DNA-binding NarL/FixJ family response regulator